MILGIHHVALKCGSAEEYAKTKDFYLNVLGLSLKREWAEGCMIDTGSGLIEIFNNDCTIPDAGAVRHFALATDNTDEIVKRVKEAGYPVFDGPRDICIPSDPPFPARIAFCYGPLHEEIEIFQEC